ncbi:hypothetical protein [Roseomonas chloroacetimidivorans]|uniref:hypothetical protein n=1 Tax=Roseomonas chloroacetimidivorans TaxID=1766656 RepID=UPI003C773CCF
MTIARWAAGISLPRPDAMAAVEELTAGAVTPADHYAAFAARKARRSQKMLGADRSAAAEAA